MTQEKDYHSLIRELLAGVGNGWSCGDVQGWLVSNKLQEGDLARWLQEYGQNLMADEEIRSQLGRLAQLRRGELAAVAEEILRGWEPQVEEWQQWFDRGNELLELGRYEDAIVSFDRAIELKPDYDLALSNRSVALGRLERYEEALVSCNHAIEIQPNNHLAWSNKGQSFSGLGKYEEGIESYNRAIEIKPDFLEAFINRGVALGELGRYEEEIESYDQAINIQTNNHFAWSNRGNLLDDLGRYEEALISYDRAINIQPDNALTWSNRGNTLGHLGRYEEAIESYDRAINIQPDDAKYWLYRGITLVGSGRYEEAIASYNQAINIQPEYCDAWLNKSSALYELGHYEESLVSCDRAIHIQPDNLRAWSNRCLIMVHLGRHEEALTSGDRAINIKPEYPGAWSSKGFALLNSGRYQEAIESYDQAIKMQSDDPIAWSEKGAILCDVLKEYEKALDCFEQAIKIQSDYDLAWVNKGVAIRYLQGYQAKIDTYEEAFQYIHPDTHPRGWGYLQHEIGCAHYQEGQNQLFNDRKNPQPYYNPALTAYHKALQTLTRQHFPKLRLETLIDLSKVHLAQRDLELASETQAEAVDIFRDLVNAQPTFAGKKRLQLKYSGLGQFNVDFFVTRNDNIRALEAAELDKNNCLTWLLSDFEETTIVPKFDEMKGLLSETTAVVYWHLSAESLTTFILTPADIQPIVWESDRGRQARELNDWLREWDRDYNDYRANKTPDRNHPWRQKITERLKQLSQILEIDKIGDRLPANLTRLILIPHRDLHRFPLHIFFLTTRRKLTKLRDCVYLPSIQIGLNLQQRGSTPPVYTPLLSISDPETEQPEFKFAPIESAIVRCLLQSNLNHSHTEIDRQSADVATVKDALTQPHATFHFTGHAGYNPRNPAVSALALTDGLLTAEEIWQFDSSSYHLVNLPACETAIVGRKDIATEYVGLASAFLHAGAASVLSTLWNVDERASTWFTIYFYQQLVAGKSPAVALTVTQFWMKNLTWQDLISWLQQLARLGNLKIGTIDRLNAHITNIQNEGSIMGLEQPTTYSHPYYWAAFTLTGRG